jgi:glycosyltransferase involved in cell wall biosynthesis
MKILIVTQVLDQRHPNLGFFVRWIHEFARQMERVTVICLEEGVHHLPENVVVYSLGKEKRQSRILYILKFYRAILKARDEYDVVFVHMNPEYVILGSLVWRLFGKKVGLWYLHKHVGLRLRLATFFAHVIFTASKESFRLTSPKIHIVGHGIDTDFFPDLTRETKDTFDIVSIGRLSPTKHHEIVIDAVTSMLARGERVTLTVVGGPGRAEDEEYARKLEDLVKEAGHENEIRFAGAVPHADLPAYLYASHVLAHTGDTGSLDKVALEAMASGLPVISSNDSVVAMLENYPDLTFSKGNASELSNGLEKLRVLSQEERNAIGESLRGLVRMNHSLPRLVTTIEKEYQELV